MDDCRLVISLDNFTIEVYEFNGATHVDICRCGIAGGKPGLTFKKGDTAPATGFLSQIAELLGVGPITITEKAEQ